MQGDNMKYRTMFGDNWVFWLGRGKNWQKIDTPGRWEDLLFAFSRDRLTGTMKEEMSYTLSFRGSGAQILRTLLTGKRGNAPLLEIRKWDPLEAKWETYYRGVIDDTTVVDHGHYVEASTTPTGVAQDLIDKADQEVTVTIQGKRIVVPRMAPYAAITAVQGEDRGITKMKDIPQGYTSWIDFSVRVQPNQEGATPALSISIGGQTGLPQPYMVPSEIDGVLIVARSGRYSITNRAVLRLSLMGFQKYYSEESFSGPLLFNSSSITGVPMFPDVPENQTYIYAGDTWIKGGDTQIVSLRKGDTVKVTVRTADNNDLILKGQVAGGQLSKITNVRLEQYVYGGSIDIMPVLNSEALLSAPAVRDTELFAQVCRQVTRNTNLAFDFTRYSPAYFSNPDGTDAAVFLLSLSRLKENQTVDGVSTIQGSGEAYFKGLTLNQFYKYFLAQGYKVAVLYDKNREGEWYPVVTVAPYCNTERGSFFFPEDPATVVDLGSAVTDLEMARYEHTFVQVVAGADPEDYGNFPREEGYQDPTNRKITYGFGVESKAEPYEIAVPFPISTFGLEEALLTYEGESDESRANRWTEGEGIHLVSGSAGNDGQIAKITQYEPVEGLYYKPLNMGFRPESLIRRNIPLLCMSLAPYDMYDTFYGVEEIEGDTISVTAQGGLTGDAFLAEGYATGDSVTETKQDDGGGQDNNPRGICRPVMLTLRSTTGQNVYGLLRDSATRYGVVRFRHRGKDVAGYLRSVEINPTEQAVQKWELLPVWSQDLTFMS